MALGTQLTLYSFWREHVVGLDLPTHFHLLSVVVQGTKFALTVSSAGFLELIGCKLCYFLLFTATFAKLTRW